MLTQTIAAQRTDDSADLVEVARSATGDVGVTVDDLSYQELAVVLAASDMPTVGPRMADAEIATAFLWAWADQGLSRLGVSLLAERVTEAQRIDRCYDVLESRYDEESPSAVRVDEQVLNRDRRRLWGSPVREDVVHARARRLTSGTVDTSDASDAPALVDEPGQRDMDVDDTFTAASGLPHARAIAGGLSYGELAIALAASDMPTTRTAVVDAQAWQWAAEGLARLGLGRLLDRAAEARRIGLRYASLMDRHGSDDTPAARAEARVIDGQSRRLWGCTDREDHAHDLAWRLTSD